MKKFLVIGVISVVAIFALLAFGVVGYAFAQARSASGSGFGMMGGGRGMMNNGAYAQVQSTPGSGYGMMGNGAYGPMHQYMIDALAGGLGLTTEELQTRLDNGETPYQVAQSLGLSDEQIKTLFEQAHDDALAQAVAAGVITQEQADRMDQHMEQRWEDGTPGFGPGNCPGMGGRGPGQSQP